MTDAPKFTREYLEGHRDRTVGWIESDLAAFALALLDRNERCRKTLEAIKKHLEIAIGDGTKLSTTYKLVEAALSELGRKEGV